MHFLDRVFPKAKDFQSFAPPDGGLPCKAAPFIWIFLKALRAPVIAIAVCYSVGATCFMLEPWFLGRIVDAVAHSAPADVWANVGLLAALYFIVSQVLGRVVYQVGHTVMMRMLPILTVTVRRRLAQYLFTHSYRYFQDDYAGRLAGKVVEMPQAVNEIVETLLDNGVFLVANFVVCATLFSQIRWYFGVGVALLFGASLVLCRWRVPILSRKAELAAATLQAMRGRYLDSITNILLVKLFGRERHEDGLFSAAIATASSASQEQGLQEVILWRGQHVINATFQIGVVILAIEGYRNGQLSVGEVTTVATMAITIVSSIWWLLRASLTLFSKFAVIEDALATIVVPTEVEDPVAPRPLPGPADVALDKVTFGYPGQTVFDGFSLVVPEGQRVGLVGPSGAGKSSLVQLLLRLFDVTEGAIRIGGQDIREVAQGDLRRSIAMIPQATDLMHRSIRDNIAYGDLDASEEQIVAAAKKAFIHDTILGLKDSHGNAGYDSLVGERGVKLSGGQRQRIAIARAFLKNAPILLLDEATSALDSESERLIQQSFDELFKGRTVIAIAHRLSTIAHLDRIVVMENGRIVEDGPHEQLVKNGALYARLWQLQSAGFIGGKNW